MNGPRRPARAAPPRLIALSGGNLSGSNPFGSNTVARDARRFLAALEAALAAGLEALVLREPLLGDRDYLALGHEVSARLRSSRASWFCVHDRPHLVRALGADALHLSFRALPADEIRPWIGDELAIGLSTHAGDEPSRWHVADYVFHGPLRGPLRPVPGKTTAPVDLAGFAAAARAAPCPLFALGGVHVEDVPALRRAGVHGVAVQSRLLGEPDPAGATRAYLEALG